MSVAEADASGMDALPQDAKGELGLCWDDSVTEASQLIGSTSTHPTGRPIRAVTKRGFKRRGEVWPFCEDARPSICITRAGREGGPVRPGLSLPL